MAKYELRINSIGGGIAPVYHQMDETQYIGGIAIDPEAPLGTANIFLDPAGAITPTQTQTISSGGLTGLTGVPMWINANNRDSNLYVYGSNGVFLSFNTSFAPTIISATISGSHGEGMAYYNNHQFLFTSADVYMYGPLDGTPQMSANAWTGSKLGSQSPLLSASTTSTPYPSVHSVQYPVHPAHAHVDGALYFGDISANGQGIINKIKTSKTTRQGDTNNGSSYGVLKLPFGYSPLDVCGFGNDLAIVASQISNYTPGVNYKTGSSAMFLWDTFSATFYRQIDIPDPLATAIYNFNGRIRIWSGMIDSYVRISDYIGSYTLEPIDYINEGAPPFAGAVDSIGYMTAHGSYGTIPGSFAGITTIGSRSGLFPSKARNVISQYTGSGTNPLITAIGFLDKSQSGIKYPFIGWTDTNATVFGIDKNGGSNASNSTFKSRIFNIGQEFEILRIRVPLANSIGPNTSIVPKVVVDNDQTSFTYQTINHTNYPAFPSYGPTIVDLKSATNTGSLTPQVRGFTNFYIQFQDQGTVPNPIVWPITITIQTLKD